MSRIDRTLAACLACLLLLTALPVRAEETLITPGDIRPSGDTYKTRVVEKGTWEQIATTSASVIYPVTEYATYRGMTARFVEYKVSRGDYVEAGDVMAVMEVTASTMEITTLELNLTRARDELATGQAERQRQIEEMRRGLASLTGVEREKAALSIEKAEIALSQFVLEQEYSIDTQQRRLDKLQEQYEQSVLVAPISGVITDLTYLKPGEQIFTGQRLATVRSEEEMLLAVSDDGGRFRYNMEVTVEIGMARRRETVPGRVVAADNMLPNNKRSGYAFIAFTLPEGTEAKNPKVMGRIVQVEDALILPRGSATLEGGNYYVYLLIDGQVRKRFVNAAAQNAGGIWVLQGLNEGDVIVVD